MWNPHIKRKDEKPNIPATGSRIHIEQPLAVSAFQNNLNMFLAEHYDRTSELVILCIGTDRSTGDSLGPLTGTKLIGLGLSPRSVYGTLEEPVHAVNLQDTIQAIKRTHKRPFIIAIDACLGRSESVGYISIKEGPLQPGTGVNKDLPAVGDLQVIGIVNIGGFMEYMVLQNTRLNLVMKMAEIISLGIYHTVQRVVRFEPGPEKIAPTLEPIST